MEITLEKGVQNHIYNEAGKKKGEGGGGGNSLKGKKIRAKAGEGV